MGNASAALEKEKASGGSRPSDKVGPGHPEWGGVSILKSQVQPKSLPSCFFFPSCMVLNRNYISVPSKENPQA